MTKDFPSPKLLDAFVERTAEALPDALPACVPDCASLGKAWRERGLRPGDLVLLCLPNGKELLHQFFGVLMAHGIPALLLPIMPAVRLREIAQTMRARAIGALRLPSGDLGAESYDNIGRLQIAFFPPAPEPAGVPGEVVMLTSGTSGFASGCVFNFEALLLNGQRHADAIGQRKEDAVLVNLPLFFSFALSALAMSSLVRGSRLVISGPPFNVGSYCKALKEQEITISSLTPILIRSILQGDGRALAIPRVLTVGGDSLEPDLVERVVRLRQGGDVYLTYGLTQAGPRVSTLAVHREPPSRYSSVGHPLAGTTISLHPIEDGSGMKELFVRSDTVMKRSIGHVEGRTHNGLVAPQTIATGDIFQQDDEGYLYFVGRLSDFISRKGEKISLAAVRRVASQLPNVVSARTQVFEHQDGSQDFDLELRIDADILEFGGQLGPRDILGRLLRRAEMPRNIRMHPANEMTAQGYK